MEDIDYDPVISPEEEEQRKRREGNYPPAAPAPKIPAEYGPPAPEASLPPVIPSASVPPVAPVVGMKGSRTLSDASDLAAMAPAAKGPQRPNRSDYVPPEPHGWSKFGHLMAAFNPATNEVFNAGPQRRGEQAYKAATQEYEAPMVDAQKEAQTKELNATATEKEAQAEAIKHPKDEAKTVLTDKGVMQWNPKTSRYDIPVGGSPIKEELQGKTQVVGDKVMQWNPDSKKYDIEVGPAPNKENASAFEKRYLELDEKKRMGQPLSQEESAFHSAYEHHKSMNTQISVNAADKRALTAREERHIQEHDKAYVVPAEAVEKSYQMMNNAYNDYKAAKAQGKELPTGAESMLALSTHLATTFGNVKGARVTKDMIEHHLGARGISDSAVVAVQKLTNGDVLSPDQWEAFHKLIGESRKLSWQTAAKEADRKHINVDFLPEDLKNTPHAPEAEKHEASPIPVGATATHQDGTKWKFNGGNSADINNWTQVPTK